MKPKALSGSSRVKRLAAIAMLLAIGMVTGGCGRLAEALPELTELEWASSTIIYDRDGTEIFRIHAGENRTPIALEKVPQYVQDAFVAIEDPNFFQHNGLNFRGIARAVWRSGLYMLDLPGGRLEGGSTITQQLARQGWLNQDITVERKLKEAAVAVQLERTYTKTEILEMYLNEIYFGRGAYGVEAAAATFFGKDVDELTIAEAAQLAGMINGPSYFDPYEFPEDSLLRRNLVLGEMLEHGFITQVQYDQAVAEQPQLGSKQREYGGARAGHFTDYVINVLEREGLAEKYGLELGDETAIARAGLRVYTTLNPELQALAERVVMEQMEAADQEYGLVGDELLPEAAMVVMNPQTGEILAMVGGREHTQMLEYNRATDALRQPGSAIKPLVAYIPAIESGLGPATILDDAPVMLTQDKSTVWPQNYNFRYQGLLPMRVGIYESNNPMAVRAMQAAGGPLKGIEYAQRLGLSTITEQYDNHLALALGGLSEGVSVLDMTTAYAAVANLGTKVDPVVVTRIEDRDGHVIFEAYPRKDHVMKASTAYLAIDMMKDTIRRGTAYGFTRGFNNWPAAGKSGTTEHNRDAWFVGFTTDMVVTVWNGYDEPTNTLPWTGAFVPVKIWNQFMNEAITEPPSDWERPSDVVSVRVCRTTGMLVNNLCPQGQAVNELFVRGTEPKSAGDMLVKAKVVQVTEKLANGTEQSRWVLWQAGCVGKAEERVFIKRPQPRALHPTAPLNVRYVPADAKDELPTEKCTPSSLWERLFGGGGDKQQPTTPDSTVPGAPDSGTQPGTTAPAPGSSMPTPPANNRGAGTGPVESPIANDGRNLGNVGAVEGAGG